MQQLPSNVTPYKQTPVFTEETVPDGLLRNHRTKPGTWARIEVLQGKLHYEIEEEEGVVLEPGRDGIVTPEQPHFVKPLGKVRFVVHFLR